MRLVVITLLLLALNASAVIEWPFLNYKENGLYITAQIGTPSQEIAFKIVQDNYCPGLTANAKNALNGFDTNASVTFRKTGDFEPNSNVTGITGTDNFVIKSLKGDSQQLTQKAFNVAAQKTGSQLERTLSLLHSVPGSQNDFIDTVLQDQTSKVVVFNYEFNKSHSIFSSDGKLTFGGSPSFCSNWRMFPEAAIQNEYQWGFQLDKIVIDDYVIENPGKARFSIDSVLTKFPSSVYNTVLEKMDVQRLKVPCNSTKIISYFINGLQIDLSVYDYSDRSNRERNKCMFFGVKNEDDFYELPMQIFDYYCLMFNYETKHIGVADRIIDPSWLYPTTQPTEHPTEKPTDSSTKQINAKTTLKSVQTTTDSNNNSFKLQFSFLILTVVILFWFFE